MKDTKDKKSADSKSIINTEENKNPENKNIKKESLRSIILAASRKDKSGKENSGKVNSSSAGSNGPVIEDKEVKRTHTIEEETTAAPTTKGIDVITKEKIDNRRKIMFRLIKVALAAALIFFLIPKAPQKMENVTDVQKYWKDAVPAVDASTIKKPDNYKVYDLKKDFGAKGDGVNNDWIPLKKAILQSEKEPLKLIIPAGKYYIASGDKDIQNYGKSKGLIIEGQGNPLLIPKNDRTRMRYEFYTMRILAEPTAYIEMSGFTVDGSMNPQDLWYKNRDGVMPKEEQPTVRGIYVEGAHNVYLHDITYQKMYGGYSIALKDYANVNIQNITLIDVGGDDVPDSWGMALYFSGHKGDAIVNVDNVKAQGMKQPGNPEGISWIGIVIENGTTQSKNPSDWMIDKNTTVNVTNSEFWDYETLVHIETMAGNIYVNADNVSGRIKDGLIISGAVGEVKNRWNNMYLEMYPYMRKKMISGMVYTWKESQSNLHTEPTGAYNQFDIYNSIIKYLDKKDYPNSVDVYAASHADNAMVHFHNSVLLNVPGYLTMNSAVDFNDSSVNLREGHSGVLEYNAGGHDTNDIVLNNSTVNKFGEWKGINTKKNKVPEKVKNEGFVAPIMDKPITEILPQS